MASSLSSSHHFPSWFCDAFGHIYCNMSFNHHGYSILNYFDVFCGCKPHAYDILEPHVYDVHDFCRGKVINGHQNHSPDCRRQRQRLHGAGDAPRRAGLGFQISENSGKYGKMRENGWTLDMRGKWDGDDGWDMLRFEDIGSAWKCRKWLVGRLEMGWRDETDVDVNPWMRWGYNIYTHNMWYIIFKCPHRILIEIRVDTFTHTQFHAHTYIYIYILYMSSMYAFIQLHQRWMGWMAANKLLSMALVLR